MDDQTSRDIQDSKGVQYLNPSKDIEVGNSIEVTILSKEKKVGGTYNLPEKDYAWRFWVTHNEVRKAWDVTSARTTTHLYRILYPSDAAPSDENFQQAIVKISKKAVSRLQDSPYEYELVSYIEQ